MRRNCNCRSYNGFLTAKGLEETGQRERQLFGVDTIDMFGYLDKDVSVSALVEVEDDFEYDPDHNELNRRFIHNGS